MSNANRPLFSIVTPVYNAAETVLETIRSVQAQSFEDWELWLVDDCSNDSSKKIIDRAVALDPRVNAIALAKQSGAAIARNTGIKAARGRYIAFLDADDLWKPQKLAIQKIVLDGGAGLVFSAYDRMDVNGQMLGTVTVPIQVDYFHALMGNSMGCLTTVYDTEIFGKVFMPQLHRRQDYALWLELLRRRGPAIGIQKSLACYRVRPKSLSSNRLAAMKATWEVYRDCEKLGLFRASWCFAHYVTNAVGKRI